MDSSKRVSIAIDGPAGAGKSTIAKMISKKLKIVYLDTGAMYRAVALKAIRQNIDTRDEEKLSKLVKDINIEVRHIDEEQRIYLDGEDVTNLIRTPEVSIGASNVAVVPEVRLKMVEIQREIASKCSVVMDGRDIGTYVLPNATLKIFLTASIEERAKRRYNEQLLKGITDVSLEDVKNDILYRDKNDSSRAFAPLAKAEDAVELDTTNMSIEEVVNKILGLIEDQC
ncbi:(d)CMP kinase [Acetivibrio clariflavus]|uniref:Cytidylate kinase n=1 Tax=Acetivibrio clariflavus (strain DSM 19732 / NBRC 101661 / EBR45) TaxID=720554 RepID=G8LU68_ACECE|nr:(d)CMP kinase [Acetivibrio clariflavus]AEV68456.1 cytidylate kinase [Acetivibrio clariflavus DSM 19732]